MKYYDLTADEEQILKDLDGGMLVSVKSVKSEKKRLKETAKNTLGKNKNINLRVSEKVVLKLKAKAIKMGIPYQTLASSVLHQYAQG